MDKTLKQIEKFHGHLGPYAVIGYRMGKIANEKLGTDPFCKRAKVYTGITPPVSCIIDGIQLSSSCTLGKGRIIIEDESTAKAEFISEENKKITIILKPEIIKEIDTTVTEENIIEYSEKIYTKSDEELFEIL
jgi:formylmethanofuran dehydrogenase subunit E